ncbi:hypothetical protein ACLBKU_01300 [Erythrobacter sp. NE805]|uniref:hypothetical protein n=1 Tax=Erythrobacter sp. NE805 TaxID=3389875 RepID=UPI00396AF45A
MMNSSQARSLGWAAVLAVCLALVTVLSFKVHAVKSEVLLAERQLIALKREKLLLETEFETRASQRQLAEWNQVEFGYGAPRAGQFLDGERQLASLGEVRGPDAPNPIRLARAEDEAGEVAAGDAPMRSPVSGAKVTLAAADGDKGATAVFAQAFGDFLIEASPIRPAKAETPRVAKPLAGKGLAE